jgi:hypothetical protein
MFLIVCLTLAWSLWQEHALFGLPEIVGFWATGSEVLAVAVAWRVICRWVDPGSEANRLGWRLRLGLFVAGLSAGIGLLFIPVIIVAAQGLK